MSLDIGCEQDPRDYLANLANVFIKLIPKIKHTGIVWINLGDAFNTPVNWGQKDHIYSTLGPEKTGFSPDNSAYTKPRFKRKAFIDEDVNWLSYGNLLALPYRLITSLCDHGYLFRGEVIWRKSNPMPEGRCRRPHRQHESIYLLVRDERHLFRVSPPVKTVWDISNDKINGRAHRSRFPLDLPKRCIDAYSKTGPDIVVFDPFSGSGSTGLAAVALGCSFLGFEIDEHQVKESNKRLLSATVSQETPLPSESLFL